LIPAAAVVVSLGLLASVSWSNLLAGTVAAVVGAVFSFFRRVDR